MAKTDERPKRRISDRSAGWSKVEREGRCRACGGNVTLNRAHLVPKSQRGDDVEANIVPLCGSGTSGCHGALHSHHDASWPSLLAGKPWTTIAARLRHTLSLTEVDYVLEKKGQDWLDLHLPA